MRPETLLDYQRANPFRPYRIRLLSGKTYDIRHPEMVKVGRDHLVYFILSDPDSPFDRWETISLLHIERVEFLEEKGSVPG